MAGHKSGGSNCPWSEFWSEFPHFMGMGVVPAPSAVNYLFWIVRRTCRQRWDCCVRCCRGIAVRMLFSTSCLRSHWSSRRRSCLTLRSLLVCCCFTSLFVCFDSHQSQIEPLQIPCATKALPTRKILPDFFWITAT